MGCSSLGRKAAASVELEHRKGVFKLSYTYSRPLWNQTALPGLGHRGYQVTAHHSYHDAFLRSLEGQRCGSSLKQISNKQHNKVYIHSYTYIGTHKQANQQELEKKIKSWET